MTYQIDLMWHTHILISIAGYRKNNSSLNDCKLEHDDSLNNRTEGGLLDTIFQATGKLWSDVHGVEYKVPSGIYRGELPEEYFNTDWLGRYLKIKEAGKRKSNVMNGLTSTYLIGQTRESSHGIQTMFM